MFFKLNQTGTYLGFGIVSLFSIQLLLNNLLNNPALYYTFYQDQLSINQVDKILEMQKQYKWLAYVFVPTIYFLKNILVTFCLYGGFFIFSKKAKFSKIFNAVVIADMILLIPQLIKIIWFSFIDTNYTLEDIQYFFPGSALSMFDPTLVQKWLLYPLQALNIFELGFWLLLAYQLKEYFEGDFTESFKNVALSYGSSYMVWILFVMFLTLNYT